MFNWQYLNVLLYFNVGLGNAQKMFVKMSVRNFEVMLSSPMIKIIGGFCQFMLFWYVGFFFLLFAHQFWGQRDDIYSSNNVTSFVY